MATRTKLTGRAISRQTWVAWRGGGMETGLAGRANERVTRAPVRRIALPAFRPRRSVGRLVRFAAALAGALVLAALVAVVALLDGSANGLPAGARIGDVAVGGLGEEAARARLTPRFEELAAQPVTFTLGEQTWSAPPAEIGISYDLEATLDAAASASTGSTGSFPGRLFGTARAESGAVVVPLAIRLDQGAFGRFLDRLDTEVGSAPADASVAISGTAVSLVPSREGLLIDREAAQSALLPLLSTLEPVSVSLGQRPVPPAIGDEQGTALAAELERALAEPLIVSDGDQQWPVAANEVAALVRMTAIERNGSRELAATLDDAGLGALIERLAAEIDTESSDAWIEDRGGWSFLVPATNGRTLRRDDLAAAFRDGLLSGVHEIPVPVDRDADPPAVTTDQLLADLGITDLLAEGDSAFAGSDPGRDTNVRLAAERVDGALVPPGGTFSYNGALGTLFDSGFATANSMIEGFATAEGGGVCQVSTTIFRAAFRAGLPIVEWWPHSFRSPFYEQAGWSPGFDAAIVQVWQEPEATTDFRFVNPTDSWMLVRVRVENGSDLRVQLLGAPTGYEVGVDDPVQEVIAPAPEAVVEVDPALPPGSVVEDRPAADALAVTVVRRVYDAAGNEIAVDPFVSSYGAQPAIRRVSSDVAETS